MDTKVPVHKNDVTGLSQPSPGSKLVGARAKVCSDHGGAVDPYDFGLDTSSGDDAKLKYPEQNYDDSFETVRDGWVVFEIPQSSQADKVTFGFEDTGTSQHPETQVDAKFLDGLRLVPAQADARAFNHSALCARLAAW